MNIAVVGATGNLGAPIVAEALSRGHRVTGFTRDAARVPLRDHLIARTVDNAHVDALGSGLAGHDAIVVAVKWTENAIDKIIDAVRQSGVNRVLIVVGAGSLRRPDNQLNYDYMKSLGIEPPTSKPAMHALEVLQTVADLDWTAISPSFKIQPGQRTGVFREGLDEMVFDASGESFISSQDFAVAIIDELENSRHLRRRFTVGY